jgi:DNA transformation protein
MSASTAEIEHFLELLEPLGPLRARRMFGGWGIDRDGVMFAVVIDGALALKVDDANRPAFEAAGSRPCVYRMRGKDLPMSYWHAPEAALDSAEAMTPWARLALDAALRKQQAGPTKRKRTAKRPA